MQGKQSSPELRLAIASGGVFLLPTCPYDTELQGHKEDSLTWEERTSVLGIGISDTRGTDHVFGLGLRAESCFFHLLARGSNVSPCLRVMTAEALVCPAFNCRNPCSMKDPTIPSQPQAVTRVALACHLLAWVAQTHSPRDSRGSNIQSFS